MISFVALHTLSRAWAELRQQGLVQDDPPVLVLCPRCHEVLWRELSERCAPMQDAQPPLGSPAQVMGFLVEDGLPAQCALHPFLSEDAVCLPLK